MQKTSFPLKRASPFTEGGFQLTLQHQRGLGGCNAGQTTASGRGSGGEAAAVSAADRAWASTTARRAGWLGSTARPATGGGMAGSVRNSVGELLHYPPVKIKEARPRSPRYLSEHERIRIADLLAAGVTVRGIAGKLGRAPSTISREIRRNSDPDGRYRPHHAEHAAEAARASRASGGSLSMRCWPTPSSDCWRSAGARSRSRTSCGCCSPISRCAGCARSRSTRRSMTRRSS